MRKIIIGILFFIIIAYFGIGFYVYGESVAVPCAVVESEKDNRPDNFSLGEKADWDPSEYFVQDYETVLIYTNDVSFKQYEDLHKSKDISPISNHGVRFSHIDMKCNSQGYRIYRINE